MKALLLLLLVGIIIVGLAKPNVQAQEQPPVASKDVYGFTVKTIDGQDKSLADYKGKVLLIVNTASLCGFTKQYKGLESIYGQFKSQGFEILAFPANNFLGQEPGSNEDIKTFCSLKFHTTFPLFSKISVKGGDISPLYQYLTTQSGFNGDITWNFNKFLVDQTGKVVARFDSSEEPESENVVGQIKQLLK